MLSTRADNLDKRRGNQEFWVKIGRNWWFEESTGIFGGIEWYQVKINSWKNEGFVKSKVEYKSIRKNHWGTEECSKSVEIIFGSNYPTMWRKITEIFRIDWRLELRKKQSSWVDFFNRSTKKWTWSYEEK